MNRNEALRRIKTALCKHVEDCYGEDEVKAVRDDVPSLKVEINAFLTIGDAFDWMSQWWFSPRQAIRLVVDAIIEGERYEDEFSAVPLVNWAT